jgi:NAD(P)-dependent dehydrogenase (short-subunit alcohol dehydrogenase family)
MATDSSKTILITGVTRGLGRAMAERFIAQGHTVIGCGRDQHDIKKLRSEHGTPHHFTALDVADEKMVQEWATRVLQSHNAPDLLLNNAALINRSAPLWEVSAEEFDKIIDVNIKGVANVLRHFLPAMIAAKSGVVVNFSSGWGRSTAPEVAPYCATKYGIEGLTLALAQELPKGMAAIPLNPGIIDTDMLRSSFGSSAGSYPNPEEWSERAVSFLLQLGPKDNGKSLTVR